MPNDGLAKLLKGKVPKLVRVGDCVMPRGIREAVAEGYRAGLEV
jgi:hypothetical protein